MTTPRAHDESMDEVCLLCGARSSFRCSACASNGLILPFCSTEHLKLVWNVHKHICGTRSRPPQLPAFTQEEADDVLARVANAKQTPDFADHITAFLKVIKTCSNGSLKDLVSKLVGQDGHLVPCPATPNLKSATPAQLVLVLRTLLAAWRGGDYDPPSSFTVAKCAALFTAITLGANFPAYDEQYSRFVHWLFVWHAARAQETRSVGWARVVNRVAGMLSNREKCLDVYGMKVRL